MVLYQVHKTAFTFVQASSGLSISDFQERLILLPYNIRREPQLVGQIKDRLSFTTEVQEEHLHILPTRYTIEAAQPHSIIIGSVLKMSEEASSEGGKVLSTPGAQEVDPFETVAVTEPATTATCAFYQPVHAPLVYARPKNVLHVYFSSAALGIMQLSDLLNNNIEVVEERSADMIVELEDMNAIFFTNLETVTKHGFRKLPHVVIADAEAVSEVLLLASRWKFHFTQCSPEHWSRDIHLEFVHLERDGDKVDDMGCVVLRRNPDAKDLLVDNVVDILIDPEVNDFYGVEIRNETEKDLYVSLFTFDVSDLSIGMYLWGPILWSHSDNIYVLVSHWMSDASQGPPFLTGCSFTIGYGNDGGLPLCYELPRGIDVDVGFLKVYFTTKPIDLRYLEQESPFNDLRHSELSFEEMQLVDVEDQWGTITCAVVQHAPPWVPGTLFEEIATDE